MSARNLGNNYSLALNTGNGTHLTILYIKNCKRGYEQTRVKTIANEFILNTLQKEEYHLTTNNIKVIPNNSRCVAVTDPDLIQLQTDLLDHLIKNHGFDQNEIEKRPLHIDLRGQPKTILEDIIIPSTNWNH